MPLSQPGMIPPQPAADSKLAEQDRRIAEQERKLAQQERDLAEKKREQALSQLEPAVKNAPAPKIAKADEPDDEEEDRTPVRDIIRNKPAASKKPIQVEEEDDEAEEEDREPDSLLYEQRNGHYKGRNLLEVADRRKKPGLSAHNGHHKAKRLVEAEDQPSTGSPVFEEYWDLL